MAPRGGRGGGTVVARSFATAIARASKGGTIEAGESETALAFEVDADALPAALVRASARLARIATPARPAHALSRRAAAVIIALVGACLNGAVAAFPTRIAVACRVVAEAVI